ncbi:hypothetical protein N7537_010423 [Penicillium hordei]|uniref:Uncharacterized protein n=1 Tax=Penicillium hordei TaxID=40994 RepID=A0AAD6GYS6_9EURO|nr:uncharacterized protein N7537_010423 [Penicillium hordei]KAJ5593519.1 hypothetical protein N7537_010423 [Penicillium hordei]
MLVEASRRREVMVRELEILWKRQVGKDAYLKSHDLTILQILQFSIYCPRTQTGPQNNISYEYAESICYFYGSIKIEEEVERHLNNHQCGAVAVAGEFPNSNLHPLSWAEEQSFVLMVLTTYAACAGPSIRDAVSKTVRLHTGRNLQLMVFDPDMSPAPDEL